MATELIGGVEIHVDEEGFMTDPVEWNEELAPALAKEIGIAAVVLSGDFEAIVLTGGMANSTLLIDEIKKHVSFLGKVTVVPGEFEMEALAAAGKRFLTGLEKPKTY